MEEKIGIKQWALEDRPREKMMAQGADALSKAELLAILIGSGSAHETAVDLMRRILEDCGGSLKRLGRLSKEDLMQYKGIGEAKAITILAACALARKRMDEQNEPQQMIQSSYDIYRYFLPRMQDLPHEECRALLLRQNHSVICDVLLSKGGITGTVVDVRELMYHAVRVRAVSIALCHNHPSGNVHPSTQDDCLTRHVAEACRTMDIQLLDHLVLSDGDYYSYCDEGKL